LVAPSKGTISALGPRDVTPDGRQSYGLLLEYSFKQADAGEVTPRLAALNGYLYDSAYEAQMCMIFDSNKKVLFLGHLSPYFSCQHCVFVVLIEDSGMICVCLDCSPRLHLSLTTCKMWRRNVLSSMVIFFLSCPPRPPLISRRFVLSSCGGGADGELDFASSGGSRSNRSARRRPARLFCQTPRALPANAVLSVQR
ncbi:unnamed protein product, partial [Ectocarpus sp. 4 AP-2014]